MLQSGAFPQACVCDNMYVCLCSTRVQVCMYNMGYTRYNRQRGSASVIPRQESRESRVYVYRVYVCIRESKSGNKADDNESTQCHEI